MSLGAQGCVLGVISMEVDAITSESVAGEEERSAHLAPGDMRTQGTVPVQL